ncbi:phosphoribosyl-ATP diphosphatase [Orrella sp. 11846]|uniref:phosphoribosyl-ATP diphosphatase n=1 Tax=Orrella sp. 11846 TaxID=3409913 RepID=UPI003B598E53
MTSQTDVLKAIADVLETRRPQDGADPQSSYVASLLSRGQDTILKKIGEESTELVMASKDQSSEMILYEMADLWFHCMVLLTHHHLRPEDVINELARRQGLSGLEEKALRSSTGGPSDE